MQISMSKTLILASLFVCVGTTSANAQAPTMLIPANDGDTLAQPADFEWTDVGADWYRLAIGSTPGGGDYYNKDVGLDLSATVYGIPSDGALVYVRITSSFGGTRYHSYYTYQAAVGSSGIAEMTTPANDGDTLAQPAVFEWTDVGADWYRLAIGSTPGGADLYNKSQGLALSATVYGLPTDGWTVYVRITSSFDGMRYHSDYTYQTAFGSSEVAEMTTPAWDGDTLAQPAVFEWTDVGADLYWLTIGSTYNGNEYYSKNQYTATTATVYGLPTNGSPVYVRLTTNIGGINFHEHYTYMAFSGDSDIAEITDPVPYSALPGSEVVFTRSEVGADRYWLMVGSTLGGNDYFAGFMSDATKLVTGLPVDGSTVYVRVRSRFGSTWYQSDANYGPTELSVMVAGNFHNCGLRESDGQTLCWGNNNYGQSSPPLGVAFTSLSAGTEFTCGLRESDGQAQCWGNSQGPPPSGVAFTSLSAGGAHACGFRASDGQLQCWGYCGTGQCNTPPGIAFTSVSTGGEFTCGLRESDGQAQCWGHGFGGATTPPPGVVFASLSSGIWHSCGLRASDGQAQCFGYNNNGQSSPPPGVVFTQVIAGGIHGCGIRASDGQAQCWGRNTYGQASPPPGVVFTSLSAGWWHTCGIRESDGLTQCWGHDGYGECTPPE